MGLTERKQIANRSSKILPKFYDGNDYYNLYTDRNNYLSILFTDQLQQNSVPKIELPNKLRTPINQSTPPQIDYTNTNLGVTDFTGGTYNRKQGPSSADSAASGAGPWFALGAWLGGGALEGLNSAENADQLRTKAGTSNSNINGVGYQRINDIDSDKYMSEYNRDTAASFLTNPMTGLTRLIWGADELEKNLREFNKNKNAINTYNRDAAATTALGLKDALENASDSGYLRAYKGKDVNTYLGKMPGKLNAWVSKGEFIFDTDTNIGSTVNRGPNDTAPAFLRGRDAVVTTKYGLADAARSAYNRGDLAGVYDVLNAQKLMHMAGYKNGKDCYPRLYEGYIPAYTNYIPASIQSAAALKQYIDASRSKIPNVNTYVENPYESLALRNLAGLRYDQYPILRLLRKERSMTDRHLDLSGGLDGSQRYLGKIINAYNHYNAVADALYKLQQGNIGLAQSYNQALLNTGNASAQRKQNALQWDTNYYSGALANKELGKQKAPASLVNIGNQYGANEFKRNQSNYMLGFYDDYVHRS